MFNTLLFIHLVISLLLIVIILLQKTSADGLSGIGGGGSGGNMGLVSGRTAANFLTKTTIFLAVIFFVNALVLANISSNGRSDLSKKIENQENTTQAVDTELDQIPANAVETVSQDVEEVNTAVVESEETKASEDLEIEAEEAEAPEEEGAPEAPTINTTGE